MANANVTQSTALNDSSPENLEAMNQDLKSFAPLVDPEELQRLTRMTANHKSPVLYMKFVAWVASLDGDFFHGLSQDANSARVLAPTTKNLEEFAAHMRMLAELAEKSAHRIRLAGLHHGDDFYAWCEEGRIADSTGGRTHA